MNITHYLKTIEKDLAAGNSTEHTHRPALKTLIESLSTGVNATNEPRRISCGAPDFIVTKRKIPLGYIEAKDVGKSLDIEEKSGQMGRYLAGLGNLILTDYLEFRWYVNEEPRLTARLAKVGGNGKIKLESKGVQEVTELLTSFINQQTPVVASPKELAERMAAIARLIRDATTKALTAERRETSVEDPLHDQLTAFRQVLMHDLTEDQFADMYAQTICYGLFSARCNARGSERFTREHAAYQLPKTNPFLRRLFNDIAGPELDDRITWAVDDLAEILNRSDIARILENFGRRTRRQDPVVHFYETFLASYDPKLRESRGVYYTPEPVVSYIVRSVDHILKTDFGLVDGLADASKVKRTLPDTSETQELHRVLILDPATGTGTFLHGVIDHIFESFRKNRGMWSKYVSDHLLPRLFGFELLMAPYAVAHLKLGLQLDETGYDFKADERLRVYLTNTLEEVHQLANAPAFTRWLTEEADAASRIKQNEPVMVVMGNPPYSKQSANLGEWIANLLRGRDTQTGKAVGSYFTVDGQPLGERNPKWLNDDYVKFIRFAQWRIEQTGYGVLAFISNHGYLDNPTFRGMRQSLMETFDDIYLLDLHGNSKRNERPPHGVEDKNVFDIQQGVVIGVFVKRDDNQPGNASVRHANLWGARELFEFNVHGERVLTGGKYHWLASHSVESTEWQTLEPQSPHYLFVPQNTELLPEYNRFWSVAKMFGVFASTVTTARNNFSMAYSPEELTRRIDDFRGNSEDDATLREKYGVKDVSYWNVSTARKELREIEDVPSFVRPYCYRPFDFRFVYYHAAVCERLRSEVMKHMHDGNVAFLSHRPQSPGDFTFAYCTDMIGDQCVAANKSAGGGNSVQFPLYVFPSGDPKGLFDSQTEGRPSELRQSNLTSEFVAEFSSRLRMVFTEDSRGDLISTFGPEDVFNYMYAVFYSPTFRDRYAEFLKNDYVRLPLTSNIELFRVLGIYGAELVGLHLMRKSTPAISNYPIPGDDLIDQVRYTAPHQAGSEIGRVWINKTQYFEGVTAEVWSSEVGGYQVLQKWLKDRKGKTLSYQELTHYQQIIAAISATIRIMAAIDTAIQTHGGFPFV